MNEHTIHADAKATLTRLKKQHPELKKPLEDSFGYAIFPSVGRASLVVGLAYGHGEVFRQGEPIGFATLSQVTVGVQVGGQTFSEVLLFHKKESLEEFLTGKVSFTANASAGIVKAAATGTSDFGGVTAHAYARGGMVLEVSLGGQKFNFVPPRRPQKELGAHEGEEQQQRGANGHDGQQREAQQEEQQEDGGDAEERSAAESDEQQETITPTRV